MHGEGFDHVITITQINVVLALFGLNIDDLHVDCLLVGVGFGDKADSVIRKVCYSLSHFGGNN
jgi:hypothetical protein